MTNRPFKYLSDKQLASMMAEKQRRANGLQSEASGLMRNVQKMRSELQRRAADAARESA